MRRGEKRMRRRPARKGSLSSHRPGLRATAVGQSTWRRSNFASARFLRTASLVLAGSVYATLALVDATLALVNATLALVNATLALALSAESMRG